MLITTHLHDANLRPDTQGHQHEEEEAGPDGGSGDLGEHVRHHYEGEAGALGRVVQLGLEGTVLQPRVCVAPAASISYYLFEVVGLQC